MPAKRRVVKVPVESQQFTWNKDEINSCCAVGAYGHFMTKEGPMYDYQADIKELTKQIMFNSKLPYNYGSGQDRGGHHYQYIIHVLFEQDALLRAEFAKAGWKELAIFPGNHGRGLVLIGIESTKPNLPGHNEEAFYDDDGDTEIDLDEYDERKHYHAIND